MFVLILLTGIIIWWPRTLQAMKNSLKITSRKGFRRFCYDFMWRAVCMCCCFAGDVTDGADLVFRLVPDRIL